MSWLKSTVIHVIAVAVSLAVAVVLVKVLNVESEVAQGAIALLVVALEKLVRAVPIIPVHDYVNE